MYIGDTFGTNVGVSGWVGGGGGGDSFLVITSNSFQEKSGGQGGGGRGSRENGGNQASVSGTNGTGGGGDGGSFNSSSGGSGGSGVVIIRSKTVKDGMVPYTPSGLLEYKDSNWVVNNYPLLSDFEGILSYSKITSTPTIPTNFNQLGGTIPYSSITGTPFIPAAATFSSVHPVGTWNATSDGKNRVYYFNNYTTYYLTSGSTC